MKEAVLNQKGFTIIEGIIVASIVGILAVIILGVIYHEDTKCIGGYKFTNPLHQYASPTQILDERGNGIPCREKE